MNKKNTSRRAMRATIIICALVFVAGNAFGLGGDYPNDRPVNNNPSWPEGMANLVNTTNRVHGFFVNAEDIFFFSGSATNLTAFLADYSQIPGVEKYRLILHEALARRSRRGRRRDGLATGSYMVVQRAGTIWPH